MQSLSEVSTTEFREALTLSTIRVSQMIHLALAAGVSFLALMMFVLYFKAIDVKPAAADFSMINILSAIHAVLLVSAWAFAKRISERQFTDANKRDAVERPFRDRQGNEMNLSPAQRCLALIRASWIIRLALPEGAAFFGLVTLVAGVLEGVPQHAPIYFLNLVSPLLFVGYIILTFPNADRLEAAFEEYFH